MGLGHISKTYAKLELPGKPARKSEGLLPRVQVTFLALSAEVVAVWADQALPSSAVFLYRLILLPVVGAASSSARKKKVADLVRLRHFEIYVRSKNGEQ
jgi:hypothetical protein